MSIWDIYRGAFPLLQIIAPEKINGIINSMLLHQKAKGFLPIWTAWGQDNYCMIGNHAIPMILSAYQNGFNGFDPKEALNAMVATSTISHINSIGKPTINMVIIHSIKLKTKPFPEHWKVAMMTGV
ncbi:MAG: glycoside hydrolase family 92 protein [Bacteroidetes bacterium]|nr:glycoside hydrolase family 92 protein [Bacteroidota bacterium]